MNDRNLSDLLPGYALGALSEGENAQVEAWLATSEEARAELHAYESTLAALTVLTPPRPTPDQMLADFQARLKNSEKTTSPASPASLVRPVVKRDKNFPRRRLILSGLAALLIAAVAIIYLIATTDSRTIQAIQNNPAAIIIPLAAQSGASGDVTLIALPDSTQAVLEAHLPNLPPNKQYELWLIRDQPVNSGVFTLDYPKNILVTLPGLVKDYKMAAITVEPWSAAGSSKPTSAPIFVAKIGS